MTSRRLRAGLESLDRTGKGSTLVSVVVDQCHQGQAGQERVQGGWERVRGVKVGCSTEQGLSCHRRPVTLTITPNLNHDPTRNLSSVAMSDDSDVAMPADDRRVRVMDW